MLFGAEPTEAEKWFGPILTSLASVAATFFAWLSSRDRLRYDVKTAEMGQQIAALTVKTDDCHRERDELRAEVAEMRKTADELRRQFDARPEKRRGKNPGYGGPDRRKDEP